MKFATDEPVTVELEVDGVIVQSKTIPAFHGREFKINRLKETVQVMRSLAKEKYGGKWAIFVILKLPDNGVGYTQTGRLPKDRFEL